MGVRMLGPVAIVDFDGADHDLAPRDRVVLATLAMSPREVVSPNRLADALWQERPPSTWTKVVQGCISRIRKNLGSDAVRTTRQGYLLDLPDEEIDGLQFARAVRRARELLTLHEADRARYVLTKALDLWYGPALADLNGWPPGEAAAAAAAEAGMEISKGSSETQARADALYGAIAGDALEREAAHLLEFEQLSRSFDECMATRGLPGPFRVLAHLDRLPGQRHLGGVDGRAGTGTVDCGARHCSVHARRG